MSTGVIGQTIVIRGRKVVPGVAEGEALVTRDRKLVYRVEDGIPVLLSEEAISTLQLPDFPTK